ncbi:Uncharacterised protein [Chryseobacterium nakagawai]|uniref:Uncharacterized protein n=1 Tax=Chryseobacterium nakagawai TaxID=1241982 RepID=A0AAD1DQW4_CHRNA|nr:hypothetical protein [Chryseobacterium nakagawai]AZA91161.1 hypothetical protein EG343_11220 [Chryseobacterium nakagawai]VEH22722.1 Uncharacterised protein [Chryseobacterium nakagawai]
MEKPSLGVIPEKIWKEKRIEDLSNAIQLRVKMCTSHPVPAEWIEELNKLRREIYGPPTKICFGKPGQENELNTFSIIKIQL